MADKKPGTMFHKLIAVVKPLETLADGILGEAQNLFSNKKDHFDGMRKVYFPYEETTDSDGKNSLPVEKLPDDIVEIVTTVDKKLDYVAEKVVPSIDAALSKEATNASGRLTAELVVDGNSFGTFSAIELLALEGWLLKLRKVYKAIPTLDPKKKWELDESDDVYTNTHVTYRSLQRPHALTMAEATDKHAAQVKLIDVSTQVGYWETVQKSGRIYPADKSKILTRLEKLYLAVVDARTEANKGEVTDVKVAKRLFNYINKGK